MKPSPFRQTCESCETRAHYPAWLDAGAVFASLASLQPRQRVPMHVYISDYDCATIPPWTVLTCQQQGGVVMLIVTDANAQPMQETLFDPPLFLTIQVVTCPAKTLSTGAFLSHPDYPEYGPKRAMLCDLLHEAKLCQKRLAHPQKARKAHEHQRTQ